MKEDLLLESFQVEELEKRYEMGWTKGVEPVGELIDPDGPGKDGPLVPSGGVKINF